MRKRSRPKYLLWVLLAILAGGGALLVLNDEVGVTLGIPNGEFAELTGLLALLLFLGSAVVARLPRPGDIIRAVVVWSVILGVLVGVYAYRTELMGVGGRILGVLVPGVPVAGSLTGDGNGTVVINRPDRGHFSVRSTIDDLPINMLVDTGASFVTLTSEDAVRLGFDTGKLQFNVPIHTANGVIQAARITVGHLQLGTIERTGLEALVAPPETLEQSLLGLSFLDTLQSYTVVGDRMVLSP